MKHEADISRQTGEAPTGKEPLPPHPLTSVETGFSYQAAAIRCEETSAQLVRLAELLRCTRPDPGSPQCVLAERAMVECMIRARQLREKFFDARLFSDPAWDIILFLYRRELDQRRTSVTNLCEDTGVPLSTVLRHINSLTARGILVRQPNNFDARVVYLELTEAAKANVGGYFERLSELFSAAAGR
jgi:DNA-binding MarR family transcriptional regulator